MPIILNESRLAGTPYIKRMIKCPGHYLIPPDVDIFLRVPIDDPQGLIKTAHDKVEYQGRVYKINKWKRATDRFGRPIVDWRKLYKLERQGIVKQPYVTAAFAIEHIYDPKSKLCLLCRLKPCREGQGTINEWSIKRLRG